MMAVKRIYFLMIGTLICKLKQISAFNFTYSFETIVIILVSYGAVQNYICVLRRPDAM